MSFQLIDLPQDRIDALRPGGQLTALRLDGLSFAGLGKSEPPDQPRQRQSLPDQGHQNDEQRDE